MCGIAGYTGFRQAMPLVLQGLQRLEYRGYDSAGIACHDGQSIQVSKTVGKVADLRRHLESQTLEGTCGMGHTRWATHGGVSDANAHPHQDQAGTVTLIHNGIVENYLDLKKELPDVTFRSETDTEVVVQYLSKLYDGEALPALSKLFAKLEGAFALVILFADRPGEIYCARKGAPLVVALGDGETLCASDVPALAEYAERIVFLEEGELCRLTPDGASFWNLEGVPHERTTSSLDVNPSMLDKGGYAHFMLKEIHEQSSVVRKVLEGRLQSGDLVWGNLLSISTEEAKKIQALHLVACGSSSYASTVAQRVLEKYLSMPITVDIASEYRYRPRPVGLNTLALFVSQSGETSDTLAAAHDSRHTCSRIVAVTNQSNSSLSRMADDVIELRAGIEVGVAATKTFTSQMLTLLLTGLQLAHLRGELPEDDRQRLAGALLQLPWKMDQTLEQAPLVDRYAKHFVTARDFLFLGRGVSFPVAMEGALKLKEISYVHAEAFAAGEMKHGPIALLDELVPSVFVAPDDELLPKTLSNLQECRARLSPVLLVTTEEAVSPDAADAIVTVPAIDADLSALLTVLPLQLFAYESARLRGCDIDQPRNLAKSVTVE